MDRERSSFWPDAARALDQEAEASRRAHRIDRATRVIPRLRAIGYAGLWALVAAHNLLVFGDPLPDLLALFALVALVHFTISKLCLVAYYTPERKPDLSDLFLAGDVPIFVMAVYASGGDRSWLLPVLCMRVADQVGTSRRRTLTFGALTALAQTAMVLSMRFLEHRQLDLVSEFAKVMLVFVCNCYLALATAPGERQRERASRMNQMMRDLIAELQRKGGELEVQRERAEAASRAKTVFLAHMSHEIRTPLTAVLGMTELLLRQRLEPAQREIAETVQLAGRSLHALVDDVLDMSKVEAGKLELYLSEVELAQVAEDAIEPLRVLSDAKHLQLDLELRGLGTRKVLADALRLRQIISNLVGNAIKFTQAGRIQVRLFGHEARDRIGAEAVASASAPVEPLGIRVHFKVEDTGIGIPKEAAQRVFEAFQQADESTTRLYGGTGLGLTISRKLVEMMGGKLTLQSVPGEGSTFEFELSFLYASDSVPTSPPANRSLMAARLRALTPHVLVVEDIEVNRLLMQDVLQSLGCTVAAVEDGLTALEVLTRDHDFDVVIMDWHMPGMDGLEVTLRVRQFEQAERRRRVPIIGFTASAFAEDVARCKDAGMEYVLHKPLVRSLLEEALWECLSVGSEAPVRAVHSGMPLDERT